jgi:hypothetical protein
MDRNEQNITNEMDTGTAVVGIIVLAAFGLPYMIDRRRRSQGKAQRLGALRALAQQHGCRLDEHGHLDEVVLGLDRDRKALFHHSTIGGGVSSQHIDLKEVRACQVHKTSRSGRATGADATPERLELWLLPKDGSKAEMRLVLCHILNSAFMEDEAKFAETWSKRINDQLKGR